MNDENVKAVIEGLNGVARDMEHWAFREDVDRVAVEDMRRKVLAGVKLLYDQDNVIRALLGEFGDACDVDGCGVESDICRYEGGEHHD
jgi:hypothetical protein